MRKLALPTGDSSKIWFASHSFLLTLFQRLATLPSGRLPYFASGTGNLILANYSWIDPLRYFD